MEPNILLCYQGELRETCIPEYFVSLDKLKDVIIIQRKTNKREKFSVFILIPNKRVRSGFDDCDFNLTIGKRNMYVYGNKINLEKLKELVLSIVRNKMNTI